MKVKELEVKIRRLKKVLSFHIDIRYRVAHSAQARSLDRKKIRQVGRLRLGCSVNGHIIWNA